VKASKNQCEVYAALALNTSIVVLLSFALRKVAQALGRSPSTVTEENQSLLVDIFIMIGMLLYFDNQPNNIKAAIYTLFLISLYLRTISIHLMNPFCMISNTLASGILPSVFIVLIFKMELVVAYSSQELGKPK
jgi:hypothetical protein